MHTLWTSSTTYFPLGLRFAIQGTLKNDIDFTCDNKFSINISHILSALFLKNDIDFTVNDTYDVVNEFKKRGRKKCKSASIMTTNYWYTSWIENMKHSRTMINHKSCPENV